MNALLKRFRNRKFLIALGLVIALILVNLLAWLLPYRVAYPDVSGEATYRLSDGTRRYLATVNENVEILYYSNGGRANADKDLYSFVLQYAAESKHISVRLVDISKTETDQSDQSIRIRSAKRERVLNASELFHYTNASYGITLTLSEYSQVLQSLSNVTDASTYQSMMEIYGPSAMTAYFSGDPNLTGAIRYVLAEETPTVSVFGKGAEGMTQMLRQQLERRGYTVTVLSSLHEIAGDALWLTVSADLTEEEASALSAYLREGGDVFLSTNYAVPNTPNLSAVLAAYGMSAPTDMNLLVDENGQTSFYAVTGDHPAIDSFSGSFVASYAHVIRLTEAEDVTQTVLFRSSNNSYSMTNAEGAEPEAGSFPLCVLAEKGESSVTWLSMPLDSISDGYSGGANFAFASELLDWLTETQTEALSIPNGAIVSTYLGVTNVTFIIWVIVFIVLIPVGVLVIGAIRTYLRRKR